MVPLVPQVLFWDLSNRFLIRHSSLSHDREIVRPLWYPMAQKLSPDLCPENLSEQRRNRVPELLLRVTSTPDDFVIVRERLYAAQLSNGQLTALPVKWTDRRTRLGLDCPSGSIFRKLKEEAPVPSAPSEKAHTATSIGMPQIVLPFGDTRQKSAPLATDS
jgi:hypothetical protein